MNQRPDKLCEQIFIYKIKINLQIVGEIKNFNKQEIENRTQVLINFFLEEFFLFQNNA